MRIGKPDEQEQPLYVEPFPESEPVQEPSPQPVPEREPVPALPR